MTRRRPRSNPIDPAARYAALKALARDPAATPGEKRNARAAMRRMEKRYGAGVATAPSTLPRSLTWVDSEGFLRPGTSPDDSPNYERYASVAALKIILIQVAR